jgi:triosephosphate isomerase
MTKKYLIAGNWKMHGTQAFAETLCVEIASLLKKEPLQHVDVLVCPPFTALGSAVKTLQKTAMLVGGQDCHHEPQGAYTGNISPVMLKNIGCTYVILGHSERRQYERESNALVREKAEAALAAGLIPIICIGETLEERETSQTLAVIERQLDGSVPREGNIVIAYEPIWAIGTGRVPTLEQVAEVHAAIAKKLKEFDGVAGHAKILYGGSVKPSNAAELLNVPHVHGALVGGASLEAASFFAIAKAAAGLYTHRN